MEKQPCAYILASLHQHRTGVTKGWAARKNALRLVGYEQHGDMESATVREKRIKHWNRDWKLNLIEAQHPEWLDLAIPLGFEPIAQSAVIDSPRG